MSIILYKHQNLSKKEFIKILEKYNEEYYYGNPSLTDEEYDNILQLYEKKYGKWGKIGANTKSEESVKLPYHLGSMDKIKNEDEKKI